MLLTRQLLVLLALSFAAACAASSGATPANYAMGSASADVVTLTRGPCYGTCPQYAVSVAANGDVVFVGFANVRVRGMSRAQIDTTAARALLTLFDDKAFADVSESYASGQPSCGRYAADAPLLELTLATATRFKRVVHDVGCSAAPALLARLERAIDSTARVSQWISR